MPMSRIVYPLTLVSVLLEALAFRESFSTVSLTSSTSKTGVTLGVTVLEGFRLAGAGAAASGRPAVSCAKGDWNETLIKC